VYPTFAFATAVLTTPVPIWDFGQLTSGDLHGEPDARDAHDLSQTSLFQGLDGGACKQVRIVKLEGGGGRRSMRLRGCPGDPQVIRR
jgi:hypothetical protein